MSKRKPKPRKRDPQPEPITVPERMVLLGAQIYHAGLTSQQPQTTVPEFSMFRRDSNGAVKRDEADKLPEV